MYTMTDLSSRSLNTRCISRWKVAGALAMPNGMTVHCLSPSGVEKASCSRHSGARGIW